MGGALVKIARSPTPVSFAAMSDPLSSLLIFVQPMAVLPFLALSLPGDTTYMHVSEAASELCWSSRRRG